MHILNAGDLRVIAHHVRRDRITHHGVVRSAGIYPCLRSGLKIRERRPHHASDGKLGHVPDRLYGLDIRDDQPHPPTHIDQRRANGDSFFTVENHPRRVALAADPQGLHVDLDRSVRDARIDLEHMRSEDQFLAFGEVICIVFHK